MRPVALLFERTAMVTVGACTTAILQACTDLTPFSPEHAAWPGLIAPAIVGFALGMSQGRFRANLIAGAALPVLTAVCYFGLYALFPFPVIPFHGGTYPPDPATRFILYFLLNTLLSLAGVVLGGFVSGGD